MRKPTRSRVIHLADALAAIPASRGEHAIGVLRHGTLDARIAVAPVRPSQLTSHAQDEVYVIVRGQGVLLHDGARDSFAAGDLLFVAAGTEHRFEDVTADLVVWVLFYGPDGGEAGGRELAVSIVPLRRI